MKKLLLRLSVFHFVFGLVSVLIMPHDKGRIISVCLMVYGVVAYFISEKMNETD